MPIVGGRSATYSATPSLYTGYKASRNDEPDDPFNRPQVIVGPPSAALSSGDISFVGSDQVSGSGALTSVTPPTVAGVAAGDLIICAANASSGTVTGWGEASYSGWTIAEDLTVTAMFHRVIYRIADGSGLDAPPTLTITPSGNTAAGTLVYRGVDETTPFIVESGTTFTTSTATLTDSQVSTDANAWGVLIGAMRQLASPVTWTPGSGMTERVDVESGTANTNNTALSMNDTNGAAGTGTISMSTSPSAAVPRGTIWSAILLPATVSGPPSITATLVASAPATASVGTSLITVISALDASAPATASVGTSPVTVISAVGASAPATASLGTVIVSRSSALSASAPASASLGTVTVDRISALSASAPASASVTGLLDITKTITASAPSTASLGAVSVGTPVAASAPASASLGTSPVIVTSALAASGSASVSVSGSLDITKTISASAPSTASLGTVALTRISALSATAGSTASLGTVALDRRSALSATATVLALLNAGTTATLSASATTSSSVSGVLTHTAAVSASAAATAAATAIVVQSFALSASAPASASSGGSIVSHAVTLAATAVALATLAVDQPFVYGQVTNGTVLFAASSGTVLFGLGSGSVFNQIGNGSVFNQIATGKILETVPAGPAT